MAYKSKFMREREAQEEKKSTASSPASSSASPSEAKSGTTKYKSKFMQSREEKQEQEKAAPSTPAKRWGDTPSLLESTREALATGAGKSAKKETVPQQSGAKRWDESMGSYAQTRKQFETGAPSAGALLQPTPVSSADIKRQIEALTDKQRELRSRAQPTYRVTSRSQDFRGLLDEAASMQPEIDRLNEAWNLAKGVENEELRRQGWRDADLGDLLLKSAKRGFTNSQYGVASYKGMLGQPNEAKKYAEQLAGEEYKFITDKWWEDAISGAAEQIGQQGRQLLDPRTVGFMAAGGAAGAISGTPIGGVGAIPGALAGAGSGFAAGSAMINFEIEAGQAYNEMRENGIDPETARNIALVVGGANAGLEFLQVDDLVKSVKILQNKGLGTAAERIMQYLGDRALGVGNDVLQEVLQEGVTVGGAQVAQKYQTGEWAYNADEVVDRLKDTATSSALAFGALSIPGAVRNIGHIATTRGNNAQVGGDVRAAGPVRQETTTESILMRLAEEGVDEQDAARQAEAIRTVMDGGEISGKKAATIATSEQAVGLLSELIGETIDTDVPLSTLKHTIQALASRATAEETSAGHRAEQNAPQSSAPTLGRPIAEQTHDMSRIARAASTLGENGAKALNAAYDGISDLATFYPGFAQYYEAGVTGRDMGLVSNDYALTEAQRLAAYSAGQNDAAASLAREQRGAQFAQVAGKDSGLVFDEYVAQALDTSTANRVNKVSKLLGLRVRFVDSVRGGTANAQISGSEVLVEKDNPNPVMFLLGHEWTHRLQETAPEQYRVFRNAVAEEIPGEARVLLEEYQRNGEDISYEAAIDEAVANYAGRMLEDGKVLDSFIEKNHDDRTLLEKVREAIRVLIRKLTGEEKRQAQTVEGKLTAALEASAKQAKVLEAQKNTAQEGGGARYSLNPDFGAQFDAWLNERTAEERKNSHFRFMVGTTSDALKSIGVSDYKIYWNASKIAAIMEKHGGMTADVIKSVPDVLENPVVVMQSQTVANRITLFGETMDADGKPVMVAVELVPQNRTGEILDFGVIASAYGRNQNSAQVLLDNSDILYVDPNEKRTNRWLLVLGLQLPSSVTTYGSISSISTFKRNVNGNISFGETGGKTAMQEAFEKAQKAKESAQESTKNSDAVYTVNATNGPRSRGPASDTTSISKDGEESNTKFSLKKYSDQERKEHNKIALEHFGRTFKWAETGYLLLDGERLDFSGRRDGAPGGYRTVDHREISDALGLDYGGDDYSDAMIQFMSEGNIRIMPESGGINLSVAPTKAQERSLDDFISKERGEVMLDIDDSNGDTIVSVEYPKGTRASKVLSDIRRYFEDGTQPYVSEVSKYRYSLKAVPPVQPINEGWERGATFDDVKAVHPTLFALDADEADTRNPTQITGTVRSYRKIYDSLKAEGFDGSILDASSGLGYGTLAGREEYGFNVDDIEPFPDAKYKPTFTDYSALDKTYDVIISNAVLNVMPQDLRDAMVVKMGQLLNPGGRAFINVRGSDVKSASSKVAINDSLMEYFISNTGSYQKGFTSKELVSYLEDALGPGFDVAPSKDFGGVSAIVTRDGGKLSLKGSENARDIARLEERTEWLREQMQVSTVAKTDKKATGRLARSILEEYSSSYDQQGLTARLSALYDFIANGKDAAGNEMSWGPVHQEAVAIANDILNGAIQQDNSMYDDYKDLRGYLRKTKLQVPRSLWGEMESAGGYDAFRKRNFGRLTLSATEGMSIDSAYRELSEMWPEFFDEARTPHPADQLLQIADVLDHLRPIWENPNTGDMGLAAEYLADDIIESFYDVPQQRPTFADRQAAKLDAAKAKGKQQVQEAKERGRAAVADQRLADDMHFGRREASLREQKNARIEEIKRHGREKVQEAIKRERSARDQKMRSLKEHYQGRETAGRERRGAAELRRKIARHASSLSQKLLRPSDKQHIPEGLRQATAAMLDAINLESAYKVDLETGKRTKGGDGLPAKRTEAFQRLRLAYADITKDGGDYTLIIDPDLMDNLNELEAMRNTPLAEMGTKQLSTVWATIKAVEASIQSSNKMLGMARFETISQVADGIKNDNIMRQDRGDYRGLLGKVDKLVNLDMLTPEGYFHRMGKTGEELFRMLRSAQDRHIEIMYTAQQATEKIIGKTDINKLEQEIHTFDVGGEKLTMSTAQIMALYELMKRQQAQDHILVGGIRPDAISNQRGLRESRRSAPVHISIDTLAEIVGVLTDEQVKIADGLQSYMGGDLAELGNEASMAVYGYRKFNEQDYFPIKVDKNQTKKDIAKDAQAQTIAGRGFTKSVTPKANNAVMVDSIFDVYASHVSDMATYAAWLPTMENVRRIRDFTFRDDKGTRVGDVKTIIERVFGKNGNAYLNGLIDNINQGVRATGTGNFTDGIVGNYKAAAVAANIRVILQQPTAILRALNTLDAKYLLAGTVKRGDWEKVMKYAPIARWKDWGYFDINTGRQMKNVLLSSDSPMDKIKQAAMAWAGKADSFAWARLWNAVEAETKDTRTGLKPGTEEFYQAVAERFSEIVDRTQVVDGILQRSQIMRSPDGLTKLSTSFMAEPTKTYNMFVNAVYDVRYADAGTRKAAKKALARTGAALVISFAVNAVAQSVVDALRDDDKEKDYWEKFLQSYAGFSGEEDTALDYWNSFWAGNLQSNLNPLSYLPYFKDLLSIFQGYDVTRMDMEAIEKVVSAADNMRKALVGEGKYTLAGASANLLAEAARMWGIPVANLKRDIQAAIATAAIETDSYLLQYRIDSALLNMGYQGNTKNFMDILYNASINDPEAYQLIYTDMVKHGMADEKIRNAMESRMKAAQGVESVAELEGRYLTPTQEQTYNSRLSSMTGSSAWKAASAEQREHLEEDLYDLTVGNSSGKTLREKIDGGAAYGISETDYLLYRLAQEVASEDGNKSTSQDEAEAAIEMLMGLSDKARAYLWQSTNKGWKENSNPYE